MIDWQEVGERRSDDIVTVLTTDIDARTPILPKSSEAYENNRKSTTEVADI